MGDARFYARTGPHALAAIAAAAHGTTRAIEKSFSGIAPLQSAGPDQVSFLDNRRYARALEKTMAGAVIVHPDMLDRVPTATIPIITTAAYEGWARVAALFHPAPPLCPGVHRSAVIAETACVDASAEIGPYAVIEADAEIGSGCRVGPFVFDRQGRDDWPRLPDRCSCQPEPRSPGRTGVHISWRPNWTGGLQLCHHRGGISEHPTVRARDRGG